MSDCVIERDGNCFCYVIFNRKKLLQCERKEQLEKGVEKQNTDVRKNQHIRIFDVFSQ